MLLPHRFIPRILSIPSTSSRPSHHPLSLLPIQLNQAFVSHVAVSLTSSEKPAAIDDPTSPPVSGDLPIRIDIDRLFVPPGAHATEGRILKGSNIVLGPYAQDAQIVAAEFVKSSVRSEECPIDGLPEFALVGRSNVGKSSLLNSLVRRKRLALTSKKPGKTQCINHFRINESWYLVDLPGYGLKRLSFQSPSDNDKASIRSAPSC